MHIIINYNAVPRFETFHIRELPPPLPRMTGEKRSDGKSKNCLSLSCKNINKIIHTVPVGVLPYKIVFRKFIQRPTLSIHIGVETMTNQPHSMFILRTANFLNADGQTGENIKKKSFFPGRVDGAPCG